MRGHNSLIGRHVESALPPPSGGGAAQRRCGPTDTTPRGETPRIQTVSKTPPTVTETKQKRSPEWGPPPSRRKDWFIQEYASRSPTDEETTGQERERAPPASQECFCVPGYSQIQTEFQCRLHNFPLPEKISDDPPREFGNWDWISVWIHECLRLRTALRFIQRRRSSLTSARTGARPHSPTL